MCATTFSMISNSANFTDVSVWDFSVRAFQFRISVRDFSVRDFSSGFFQFGMAKVQFGIGEL